MTLSHRTLMILAALIWYGGGIALLFKSGSLIKGAYAINPDSMWVYIAPLLGIGIGLIKAKLIFFKSCRKNITRIRALAAPRPWQCYSPGMLLFLACIIPTGAWMSRAAAGKFGYLCFVGGMDLTISIALLTSSLIFWQMKAFSAETGSAYAKGLQPERE